MTDRVVEKLPLAQPPPPYSPLFQVEKVLYEITKGVMGAAPDVNAPLPEAEGAEEAAPVEELAARLQALRE